MSEDGAPRSTSLSRGFKPNAGMGLIGYLVGVLMLPLLIPLAPFLLLAWLLGKLSGE